MIIKLMMKILIKILSYGEKSKSYKKKQYQRMKKIAKIQMNQINVL